MQKMRMKYRLPMLASALLACSAPADEEGTARIGQLLEGAENEQVDPVTLQSEIEAAEEDLNLTAEARGWSIEEARAQFEAADAVGNIAEVLAEKRPDIFIASVLSEIPGGPPSIFIKGPADRETLELVNSSGLAIDVSDGHPFSLGELRERTARVTAGLVAAGFQNFSSYARHDEDGLVRVQLTREAGLPETPDAIAEALPEALRSSASISIQDGCRSFVTTIIS